MFDRRTVLAGLGAVGLTPVGGATNPADLAGDLAILDEALALHPGLHRYNSPRQIRTRLAALRPAWLAAPDLSARYLLLSRFLATIRCGHTYANFFNQRKAAAQALFDRPTLLPFQFAWIGGRMVVVRDASGTGLLPRGTVVERVNGIAAPQLLATLMPYARADGHNDVKRVALLEVRGQERIGFFDVFHGLTTPAPADGVHRLIVSSPDERERTVTVPASAPAQRRAATRMAATDGDQPIWTWTERADGIVTLTMPTWALYDSKWHWRAWLDGRLDSLGAAKGLVIDLRANEGGQDCGDPILARLVRAPLVEVGAERRVRYRRTPPSLDPHLDTWDQSFRTLGVDAQALGDGWFRLPDGEADGTIRPSGKRLVLPVAILIGPTNSSATFQFAAKARRGGVARLFGATTGGNRRGINGGRFFFVRLPASGIEFDLPLIGYFPPGRQPDAGIVPDEPVAPTVADIAAGRDPVLARAIGWIARA